ncbi:GES-1 protein [Aphelenchoides avenae]|nr:GES-1 protein [Aphelenchus avenae]
MASYHGYENISDNFVSRDIVVVTIQYRLGMFGFLSNGDDVLPGNLGLWDQRAALVWVRDNIAFFGGDPKRVTVWGQSAGSASVAALSVSKHTRDLFQQAIQQSGSLLARWAANERVVDSSRELAFLLGCPIDDSKEMKLCFKEKTQEDILSLAIPLVRGEMEFVPYNPRIDGDFFEKDFQSMINDAPPKPTMVGFNTHESIFLTIEYPNTVFAIHSDLTVGTDKFPKFGFKEMSAIVEQQTSRGEFHGDSKQFLDDVMKTYANKTWPLHKDFRFYLEQYTLLVSDIAFIMPALWEARSKAEAGWPVYAFQFDHVNDELVKKLPFRAVVHAGEYPYLFGKSVFGNFEFDNDDRKVRDRMSEMFANFIKTGDPSTKSMKWPVISNASMPMVRVRPQPIVVTRPWVLSRLRQWDRLSKQYSYDYITGTPKDCPECNKPSDSSAFEGIFQ